MPDCSIDAIKIAKSIQKDELDILRGKEFKFRVKIKKRKRMKKTNEGKMTLAKLAKQINSRFDNFENGINTRINNLEKDINARLDLIEKRLDYNNLKKLPENR